MRNEMNIFGIKILTKKGLEKLEGEAFSRAVSELVGLLRKKDKIFLEPMTMVGDHQTVTNCAFLGNGYLVISTAFEEKMK
jgi:hypothetical protein